MILDALAARQVDAIPPARDPDEISRLEPVP
jgi:hypothetical protein